MDLVEVLLALHGLDREEQFAYLQEEEIDPFLVGPLMNALDDEGNFPSLPGVDLSSLQLHQIEVGIDPDMDCCEDESCDLDGCCQEDEWSDMTTDELKDLVEDELGIELSKSAARCDALGILRAASERGLI